MRSVVLAMLLLGGCSFAPEQEDRRRVDALVAELRQMNQKLEEYKERIDRLNKALELMTRLQGAK